MWRRRRRGFSLIEVMIAMAVILIASVGALLGMLTVSNELKAGQVRLVQAVLLDASVQRIRLTDKTKLIASAAAYTLNGTNSPETLAQGAAPWTIDATANTTADTRDLSTGAFFRLSQNGTVTRFTPASAPTSCADATTIPSDVYCREIAVLQGAPVQTPGTILVAGTPAATVWVRVLRQGAPLGQGLFTREVVTQ